MSHYIAWYPITAVFGIACLYAGRSVVTQGIASVELTTGITFVAGLFALVTLVLTVAEKVKPIEDPELRRSSIQREEK